MFKPWWQHDSHTLEATDIRCDGQSLSALARQHGTPLYVYSRATVQRQLRCMQAALATVGLRHRVWYAMKSNRHPGVLGAVRACGDVGIDACSPREVALARASGFGADEISFNAGMLSMRDLTTLVEAGVHCTLDTLSALQRYASLVPRGTRVGLRFNSGVRVGYSADPRLTYGAAKFGFEADALPEVLAHVDRLGLRVDVVHMHLGWGLREEGLPLVSRAFAQLAAIARAIPGLVAVNVGGGLGGRYVEADHPLAIEHWAELLAKDFGPLGVEVWCEPGTFVSAPSGMLVVEANTIETRRGVTWLGVNAGFAVNLNPAMYDIALTSIALQQPLAAPTQRYTIAGNINESGDVFGRDVALPEIREGDLLAFFPAGAYGASMASDHCLRGCAMEIAV